VVLAAASAGVAIAAAAACQPPAIAQPYGVPIYLYDAGEPGPPGVDAATVTATEQDAGASAVAPVESPPDGGQRTP
jgi:hypothetical protein